MHKRVLALEPGPGQFRGQPLPSTIVINALCDLSNWVGYEIQLQLLSGAAGVVTTTQSGTLTTVIDGDATWYTIDNDRSGILTWDNCGRPRRAHSSSQQTRLLLSGASTYDGRILVSWFQFSRVLPGDVRAVCEQSGELVVWLMLDSGVWSLVEVDRIPWHVIKAIKDAAITLLYNCGTEGMLYARQLKHTDTPTW